MSVESLLLIFKYRWKTFLVIYATVLLLAVGITFALPKQYKSNTQILIDTKLIDPSNSQSSLSQLSPGYMSTQVDIINSDRVANKVIEKLNLAKDEEWQKKWRKENPTNGTIENFLIRKLEKRLDVKTSREGSVLVIEYTDNSAQSAADITNAFAESYIDANLELKIDPAKKYAELFVQKTEKLRTELELAQNKLSSFQKLNGLVISDDKIDIENARLAELSAQVAAAQGQKLDSNSRARQAEVGTDSQDVLQNPLIQSLQAEVIRQEAKLKELNNQYGVNHPQYQNALSQLNELKAKLQQEGKKVANSLTGTTKANTFKESELKQALEQQKKRMLDLRKLKDENAALQRDVDIAQKAYDAASQRLSQSTMETQTQQANAIIISRATPPVEASSPKLSLNVLLGSFLGLVLASLGICILELNQKVIRTDNDIQSKLNIASLASLPLFLHIDNQTKAIKTNKTTSAEELIKVLTFDHVQNTSNIEPLSVTLSKIDSIGEILLNNGKISRDQIARIQSEQEKSKKRFGDVAIQLGILNKEDIDLALATQYDYSVLSKDNASLHPSLVSALQPQHVIVEKFRILRSQLLLRWIKPHPGHKTISIVSPNNQDGRSFIAANLAIVFSQLGEKTLLIDADLRNSSQHRLFNLENRTGLSSVLSGRSGAESVVQIAGLNYLSVLPAGPIPPNPQELLSRTLFSRLLDEARKVFDIIIIDTSSSNDNSDSQIIASITGASMVVIRKNHTDLDSHNDLLESLSVAGTHIIGAVSNEA
ncbi:chain length determinant protein EpsF [Ampullimonas aquatilis]|uniref:chain length determinant protein EpsF n=1 Tax=Ampullimonas aquatilis TaxID=1341549 RepID=UPI003C7495DF